MRLGILHDFGVDYATSVDDSRRWVQNVGPGSSALAANYTAYWTDYLTDVLTWIEALATSESYTYVDHYIRNPFGIQGQALGDPEFFQYTIAKQQTVPSLSYLTSTFFNGFLAKLVARSGTRVTVEIGAPGADTYEVEPTGDSGGSSANEYRPISYYEALAADGGTTLAKASRSEFKLYSDAGVHLALSSLQGKDVSSSEYGGGAFWRFLQNNSGKLVVAGDVHRIDTESHYAGVPAAVNWETAKTVWGGAVDGAKYEDPVAGPADFNVRYSANSTGYETDGGVLVLLGDDQSDDGTPDTMGSAGRRTEVDAMVTLADGWFGASAYATCLVTAKQAKDFSDNSITALSLLT